MHNISVFPLKNNELSDLTNIIRFELEIYQNNNSPFFDDYIATLNTVVGLGFAVMTISNEDHFLSVYQKHFNQFIAHRIKTKETLSDDNITVLSESTSKMVELAYHAFQYTKLPRFFDDFVVAFHGVLGRLAVHGADKKLLDAAERLSCTITRLKSRWSW